MLNQEKIKMFGEKETYKKFGIFNADSIKQVEMEKKRILEERETFSRPGSAAGISSKG